MTPLSDLRGDAGRGSETQLLGPPPALTLRVQGELVVGRDAGRVSVVLDHPSVSRRHALLRAAPDGIVVRDLGSTNGVFVNGARISGERGLREGDLVEFGPFAYAAAGRELHRREPAAGALLDARRLTREVSVEGERRRLLDDVSLSVDAGEFLAILGGSGCGKSTLLRVLSGRSAPSAGEVWLDGRELLAHFDLLKHTVAFVPQRETLPEDLVLRSALRYTARLRLPADLGAAELDRVVEEALGRVGLVEQAGVRIGHLSGGQRKRAALANELLARPKILFLDEVTSGLDESTDRDMMRLFRRLAEQGVAVVCVTHTVASVAAECDAVAVMAPGGRLIFHGPPEGALEYFAVGSLSDVYERLASRPAEEWSGRHRASPARAAGPPRPMRGPRDRRAPLAQLPVLTHRAVAVTLADGRTLGFALAQSLCVGILFRLVFGAGTVQGPAALQFAFLLGVSSFWFGCSNASKEIVKERPLFQLERNVNLRIPSYVLSKIVVLAAFGAMQVILLHGVIALSDVRVEHARELLALHLLMVAVGSGLGLAISAYAERDAQAATLVPIALIPQILLSAAVVPALPAVAERLAQTGVSAYWMYRAQSALLGDPSLGPGPPLAYLLAHLSAYLALAMATLWLASRRQL